LSHLCLKLATDRFSCSRSCYPRACMPARFSGIRSPTARFLRSTVSLTALHIVKTLAITGCGGASEASWTRVGHICAIN